MSLRNCKVGKQRDLGKFVSHFHYSMCFVVKPPAINFVPDAFLDDKKRLLSPCNISFYLVRRIEGLDLAIPSVCKPCRLHDIYLLRKDSKLWVDKCRV